MHPDRHQVLHDEIKDGRGRLESAVTFDDDGHMVQRSCFSILCGRTQGTYIVERTFDSHGNWTSEIERRKTNSGAEISGARFREFSYYDIDSEMRAVPTIAPWEVPGRDTSRAASLPLAPRP